MKKLSLLLICIIPFFANAKYGSGSIIDTCNYLKDIGFNTKAYKKSYNTTYKCSTNYIDVGVPSSFLLANNIAYYAVGNEKLITQLKLVINVNQIDMRSEIIKKLLTTSEKLTQKALGINLPSQISDAIKKPKSISYLYGEINLKVTYIPWDTGNGFEVHYIIN